MGRSGVTEVGGAGGWVSRGFELRGPEAHHVCREMASVAWRDVLPHQPPGGGSCQEINIAGIGLLLTTLTAHRITRRHFTLTQRGLCSGAAGSCRWSSDRSGAGARPEVGWGPAAPVFGLSKQME